MKELPELEIRRQIYGHIKKNPGIHAREVAQQISISGQLADYHLLYMERQDLIIGIKEEGYRRYYIKDAMGIKDRRRIGILRQDIPLKIVIYLLKKPYSKHREILENFSISKSTLTYHLKKLVKHETSPNILKGKRRSILSLMKKKSWSFSYVTNHIPGKKDLRMHGWISNGQGVHRRKSFGAELRSIKPMLE